MATLLLMPSQAGYLVSPIDDVRVAKMDGGSNKLKARNSTPLARIQCQWSMFYSDYEYLMAFYRKNQYKEFQLTLFVEDSNAAAHTCRFVQNTLTMASFSGMIINASCQIDARRVLPSGASDEALIDGF